MRNRSSEKGAESNDVENKIGDGEERPRYHTRCSVKFINNRPKPVHHLNKGVRY